MLPQFLRMKNITCSRAVCAGLLPRPRNPFSPSLRKGKNKRQLLLLAHINHFASQGANALYFTAKTSGFVLHWWPIGPLQMLHLLHDICKISHSKWQHTRHWKYLSQDKNGWSSTKMIEFWWNKLMFRLQLLSWQQTFNIFAKQKEHPWSHSSLFSPAHNYKLCTITKITSEDDCIVTVCIIYIPTFFQKTSGYYIPISMLGKHTYGCKACAYALW